MSKPKSRSTRALRSSTALHHTKSRMSGWSTFSTTIFAARRVLPPDLIVPADASAPRMKLSGPLVDEQVGELFGEDRGVGLGGEVAVLDPPPGDRVDHPADHLPDAGLALRRAERPAEVLLGDDVRGVLGPVLRELHAALLE